MNGFLKIFGWPVLLALASAVGLLGALLGDGPWDWLSWLCLIAPLGVLAFVLTTRRG
ncbi:MAG: hypothetical protein Q7T61_04905 [Caulobacter sp.]|nr:hypothetical protein [Caulobacter sp.]